MPEKRMKIGVVGAGTMGTGIAQVAAMAGHEVLLFDTRTDAIENARNVLRNMLTRLAEKGRIDDREAQAIFGRMYFLDSMTGLGQTGLVIEAVVEDAEVKRAVFDQLEHLCPAETILATNTSSLSVTSIAGKCSRPERVIGIHFFNPAPLMALVEVVPALQTSQSIIREVVQLLDSWGKTVVIAGDSPGFIVNRIARPFYSEALKIYEERALHGI